MSSIDRPAHVLKAEKTLAIPRHLIYFDTESVMRQTPAGETEHTLKLGWACYSRKSERRRKKKEVWQQFNHPVAFWLFVQRYCQAKNKLWIIAHNLSFDFTIVQGWKYLHDMGFKLKFFYSSGLTTIIKVRKKGSSILLIDSLNWFHESIEQLGKRLNIPKLEIDFDTACFFELSIYCHRDVEILKATVESLIRFLEDNRISRLCYTLGSTAMAAYLFRHYHQKIYIHNNAKAIELERDSYKGGRTECFYIGELHHGPFYVVDVNSLYPFVMRDCLYPMRYSRIHHSCSVDTLSSYLENHAVVARVVIKTDEPVYAVKSERTIFPIGTFPVTLTTGELKYAIARDHVQSIESAILYESSSLFGGYVDRFYALRKQCGVSGQPVFEHFCKLLLNSLYGKFGQKAETWTKIGKCPGEIDRIEDLIDAVEHRRRKLRYLLGEIFELTAFGESIHSFPAIAAHVTAYGRLHLWHLMQRVGYGNYFYCDTDSLFINQTGLDRLKDELDDSQLGKLKVDQTTSFIRIFGLKDYQTEAKTVIKGIKKLSVQLGDKVYSQECWPSLQGLLRNPETDTYKTIKQIKHLKREYLKGMIDAEGWVLPYYLDVLD